MLVLKLWCECTQIYQQQTHVLWAGEFLTLQIYIHSKRLDVYQNYKNYVSFKIR